MIPVWSSATVGGLPLAGLKKVPPALQNQIFTRTQGSGAEVIRRIGGAGWAVGATIAETIHAVALDTKALLPVSSQQHGASRDISISVPTVMGRAGVIDHVELDLWPKELQGLQASGRALRETLNKVI